jgi:hypothetical protein
MAKKIPDEIPEKRKAVLTGNEGTANALELPPEQDIPRAFLITPEQAEYLRVAAFRLRTRQAKIVRKALDEYIKRNPL